MYARTYSGTREVLPCLRQRCVFRRAQKITQTGWRRRRTRAAPDGLEFSSSERIFAAESINLWPHCIYSHEAAVIVINIKFLVAVNKNNDQRATDSKTSLGDGEVSSAEFRVAFGRSIIAVSFFFFKIFPDNRRRIRDFRSTFTEHADKNDGSPRVRWLAL